MTEYIHRNIDSELIAWKEDSMRKPLLLRGARQVGKSSAVKNFGKQFEYFAEVNFERNKAIKTFFQGDIDVRLIAKKISSYINVPVEAGKTLLFLDEIQECPEAIMALRFFKEDYPELHVIAAGSLLEFALQELPTFGVGRIHSLFMYPMTFDEFLHANHEEGLILLRNEAYGNQSLDQAFHDKLVEYFRTYLLVGGMPESVLAWTKTHDFNRCRNIQEDIILTYEDDFSKYKKRVNPDLLRTTGLGRDYKVFGFYEFKNSSLAQAIANSSKATVFAFPVRTDYQFTLGTWSERRFGFPNPAPKMKSIDGAVLTPHGAAHPVAAGNSPAFLYQGMMRYNPKK